MRKVIGLGILVLLFGLLHSVFPNVLWEAFWEFSFKNAPVPAGRSQAPERSPKIKADKKGFPHVNFSDGIDAFADDGGTSGAPAAAIASGDFDSDGIRDLVSIDGGGVVTLFRGNPDLIYPNSPEAKQKQLNGTSSDKPFYAGGRTFSLGIAPDFLAAGDFNADGRSDVLAAAMGADSLLVAIGDGHGNFVAGMSVQLGGKITVVATGEIGRQDGQTDVAVGVLDGNGDPQLLVFEHPEGTFKHKPEVFPLESIPNGLAIGQLDMDAFGDVAIAGGSTLTIIHGRGQAYPLDLKADLNIERPSAAVQSRQLGFEIAGLTIGKFTRSRIDSLALLANDGTIFTLEPQKTAVKTRTSSRGQVQTRNAIFGPTDNDVDRRRFVTLETASPRNELEAGQLGYEMMDSSIPEKEREAIRQRELAKTAAEFAKLSSVAQNTIMSGKSRKTLEDADRRREGLMRSISPRPIPLENFKIEQLISDERLLNAANSSIIGRMSAAAVSDSGRDDLILVDPVGMQIHIVAVTQALPSAINVKQGKRTISADVVNANQDACARACLVSLDTVEAPKAILPMRLNSDGLSDLVILHENSPVPTVLMTVPASTYVVNVTDDDSGGSCDGTQPCALRRAMFLANTNGGADLITFNIGGGGVQTIHPLSELPDLTDTITIDGTTQPGFAGTPLIEIKGDLLSGGIDGVSLKTSNSVIRGLAVNEMPRADNGNGSVTGGEGIVIFSTSSFPNVGTNIVEGNFLGTDPTGTISKANTSTGLSIFDSDNNTIGGTAPQARNLMSGNREPQGTAPLAVGLSVTGGNNNFIKGNYIGTDTTGTQKLRNTRGVFFTGVDNVFGGDEAGAGNVVSGNGGPQNQFGQCAGQGIVVAALIDLDTGALITDNNAFRGNLIGTDFSGMAPLGNCQVGISSVGNLNTFIGSITQSGRNTIADNGWDAVWCGQNASYLYPVSGTCYIVGNNIGTDITGTVALRNDQRNNTCTGFCIVTNTVWLSTSEIDFVVVGSPGGTTPGGDCTGFCNLVSGNYAPTLGGGGVYFSGTGQALVINNYLGVNKSGTSALPNFMGFNAYYGSFNFGGPLSDGMGGFIDGGNLVSGNYSGGASATAIAPGGTFKIQGNLIGTSANGINAIPNGIGGSLSAGISAQTQPGTRVQIGALNILERNVIAATTSDGAGTRGKGMSLSTYGQATVVNNYIGVNKFGAPMGNTGVGIEASGSGLAQIGGTSPGEANLIKNNGKAGVFVARFTGFGGSVTPARAVIIRGNSIYNNGTLGIELGDLVLGQFDPDGIPNQNDCFDEDDGGNNYQNYPLLLAPVFNGDGTVTVQGTLRSRPANNYIVDLYSNTAADPSDHGEGETHIGEMAIRTDGNGFAAFTFTSPGPVNPSHKITATAMDYFGNTSEFSCYAGQCSSGTIEQAIELAAQALTCVQPIVVTVNTDESDPNTGDGFCDVDLNTSGMQCSLRAAIEEANARNGLDVINFNIPGAGVQTIAPATQLPTVTERVIIDATSQPGYTDSAPVIELRGDAGNALMGLLVQTNDATVTGLVINRFAEAGIEIRGNENSVERCFIGLNPDGMTGDTSRQQLAGVLIRNTNSQNNRIGGSFVAGNVIGNNTSGVWFSGAGVKNNFVTNNKIGTDKNGTAAVPNIYGVLVTASANLNTIGGAMYNETNLISGNTEVGVYLNTSASNNTVSGNLIGTDVTGNSHLRNGFSGVILASGASNNTIGGSQSERNVISGNTGTVQNTSSAIVISDNSTTQNKIKGNYIGTNRDGNAPVANGWGISILGSSGNIIGGDPLAGNLIAGNHIAIALGPSATSDPSGNTISYNTIGTENGDLAMSNTTGIAFLDQVTGTNVSHNTISGNTNYGIVMGSVTPGAVPSGNTISQNKIGTDRNGFTASPNRHGIVMAFGSNNNTITGNLISGNSERGLWIGEGFAFLEIENLRAVFAGLKTAPTATAFTENNVVQGNLIGTDGAGINAIPNGELGMYIGENAMNNQIGGRRSAQEGNTVSGHTLTSGYGILLGSTSGGQQPSGNKIQGNRIGIKAFHAGVLPNTKNFLIQNASGNFIGPDQNADCGPNNGDLPCDDFGNIIGGSQTDGVHVVGSTTTDNVFANNYVGVLPAGMQIANTGNGFTLSDDQSNSLLDNTIGGNGGNGIEVQGTAPMPREPRRTQLAQLGGGFLTKISGNIVGLTKQQLSGSLRQMGNGQGGIKLVNAQFVLVGNLLSSPSKNVVSANGGPGILIEGANGSDNVIRDSIVGTDENGNSAVGNNGDGIKIDGSQNIIVGADNSTGLTGNVVSGNSGNGVTVQGNQNTGQSRLFGNLIGVIKRSGITERLGNLQHGVLIKAVNSVEIGGTLAGLRNIVGGNQGAGIVIGGQNSATFANKVVNNLIGTDDMDTPNLGNDGDGVWVTEGASSNEIGGQSPNTGNVITDNGGAGVLIDNNAGQGNLVDPNAIYNNGGLGIDIGNVGFSINDHGDADEGPNRGQNYPDIADFYIDGNGDLIVTYQMSSDPQNSDYGTNGLYVEFFKADVSGEGESFLGFDNYTVMDHGNQKTINLGNAALLGFAQGDLLTATATDAQNNTSEFYPAIAPTAAAVTVGGRVVTQTGLPVQRALLSLVDSSGQVRRAFTNSFGYYRFEDVEIGRTYILSVSHNRYEFVQPSIVLTLSDEVTDANFTAIE